MADVSDKSSPEQLFKDKLEQLMIAEFSEISKRYESYDPKTRSVLFLDKLHLVSNFIAVAIAASEIDNIERREQDRQKYKENNSSFTPDRSRVEAMKRAADAFKKELNALEKYVCSD